jgi:O-acetyl-ADP-ribose deacetylase (regulator of RNase III)
MIEQLWLVHPEREACDAMAARFDGVTNARVMQVAFPDLPQHDCFVTAGNSYGVMTAGIDAAVVAHCGVNLMQRVQREIIDRYRGEQPIGTAFVLETGRPEIPYLAHAPTMRIPGSIDGTDKVYAATWASLLAAHHFAAQPIRTICFPAMGTGFGQISFDEAARQMAVAWRHYLNPPTRIDRNWDWVIDRHKAIAYDGERRVLRGC